MRKCSYGTRLGTSLAATVLAIGLAAAPSLATTAKTWTVKPGGSFSGRSGKVTFTDTATRSPVQCLSSSISGKLESGSGLPGTHIASITTLSFGSAFSCSFGGGAADFTFTAHGFPYHLNANSYDTASGETTASVTGIDVLIQGNTCFATILGRTDSTLGTAKGKYTNSTHKLQIITSGSTLHVYNVNPNCAALLFWQSGDPVTMSASYAVTPAQTIKSP